MNQHFKLSEKEIAEGTGALVDYPVDTTNLALAKDIFGMGAVSDNEKGMNKHKEVEMELFCNF